MLLKRDIILLKKIKLKSGHRSKMSANLASQYLYAFESRSRHPTKINKNLSLTWMSTISNLKRKRNNQEIIYWEVKPSLRRSFNWWTWKNLWVALHINLMSSWVASSLIILLQLGQFYLLSLSVILFCWKSNFSSKRYLIGERTNQSQSIRICLKEEY